MAQCINVRELKRRVEIEGEAKTLAHLKEALQSGKLKARDFSVRALAEGFMGSEWVRMLSSQKGGFVSLQEATTAVSTAAFASITGQIVYNKILEDYNRPEFLHTDLVETIPTTFLDGERMAGIGHIGDKIETVNEGDPYPSAGINEEYIDTPATVRRGLIVPVTKDIIVADRTGLLLERAGNVGYWMGVNKEKRCLDEVFGITNTYKRNGTSTNTYLTSGAYINSHSNTLVDWTDIENAELLLDAITDPNTGEPILHRPNTVIVPSALKKTAQRILNATEIGAVDNTNSATTVRMFSPNPSPFYGGSYKILSSPYVKARTTSSSTWFLGDPKRSFGYTEVWKAEVATAGNNSELAFTSDIVMRYKVSERGAVFTKNPRFMVRNT